VYPFFDFFVSIHDVRYVVLAAAICLTSSYACVSLLRHARRSSGRAAKIWNIISALAVGFGIWATHFVAMLAFRPGFTLAYELPLTALSLLIAIAVCGAGLAFAIRSDLAVDRFLGGAVVGIGISSMHYVGIFGLMIGGTIDWDAQLVALSIISGTVLSGVAIMLAGRTGRKSLFGAAGLLTLAICTMHFTAMGAADFSRCFPLVTEGSINSGMMAIIVALISLFILAAAFGSIVLDEADRRRTQRERERELADAEQIEQMRLRLELALAHMAQGLALFGANGDVLLHNQRILELLGLPPDFDLVGRTLRDICARVMTAPGAEGAPNADAIEQMHQRHRGLARAGGEVVHGLGSEIFLRVQHTPTGDGGWVTMIEDISDSKRSEAAISHLAKHDPLTGLPNRTRFEELFAAAIDQSDEKGERLAVIAIDLDRFKDINDSYGHAAGDRVLAALAEKFKEAIRPGEIVARIGGDEFAALKPFSSMENLREFLSRLNRGLSGKVTYSDNVVETSGSMGVAIYPGDGTDRSKLLSNADLALYRAKGELDQRICYYESEMDEQARERRAMARDLWKAVEEEGFTLVYQVQKSVLSDSVTGYEVLLRWDRPGHGPVSPAEFIPVAEECGAIIAIGNWVLRKACEEAVLWPEPYKIAVNVSGVQLGQIELVDLVKMVLFQTGLAPERLELEVTETAIIADKKRAMTVLKQIKALGVSIAIDDFGTGYSSLDTLRSFPFDKIKLDRSFMGEVQESEQAKAIVRAILALGRSLSVPVLAEGVETAEQLEVLRFEGCMEAQGFLLGRPGRIDWDDTLEPMRA
jgi:diguanylate cyclase (GGDEF)-like protein